MTRCLPQAVPSTSMAATAATAQAAPYLAPLLMAHPARRALADIAGVLAVEQSALTIIRGQRQGSGPAGGFNSGGGFGGGGGYGYGTSKYGPTYGNLLTKLQGGSGGSGGDDSYYHDGNGQGADSGGGGGGGGGGAIEINARGNLTLAGNLSMNGGSGAYGAHAGSGGAGGGVLLAGNRVTMTQTGQVDANGGSGASGGFPTNSGAGGGGGRITIQTVDSNGFVNDGVLNVKGGQGNPSDNYVGSNFVGPYISNGDTGIITVNGNVTNTPAPGSLLVALLGAVPVVAMLRKRRK